MFLLFYLRSSSYIVLLFLLECASALVFSLVPFVGDQYYRRKKSALAYIPDIDGSALQPDPISYLSPTLSIQSFWLPSPYHSAGMIEGSAPDLNVYSSSKQMASRAEEPQWTGRQKFHKNMTRDICSSSCMQVWFLRKQISISKFRRTIYNPGLAEINELPRLPPANRASSVMESPGRTTWVRTQTIAVLETSLSAATKTFFERLSFLSTNKWFILIPANLESL